MIGALAAKAQHVVAAILERAEPGPLYIGTSGNMTIERLAWNAGWRELHGNDISIYSVALGKLCLGEKLDMKPVGEWSWLEKYISDATGQVAALQVLGRMGEFNRDLPYHRRVFQGYLRRWDELYEGAREKLKARLDEFKITSFFAGDVVDFVANMPEDGLFISYPPTYCLARNERILTADLRWVPAGHLNVGDRLLSFDEDGGNAERRRRWSWGVVTRSTPESVANCVTVELEDGTKIVCTDDHPWLADLYDSSGHREWVKARDLEGKYVLRAFRPWIANNQWDAGWLAGMIDGEGCLQIKPERVGLSIVQAGGTTADELHRRLSDLGFEAGIRHRPPAKEGRKPITVAEVNSFPEALRLIGTVRAGRLIRKFRSLEISERAVHAERVRVVSVSKPFPEWIQSITVSTGTYVGEGFLMHNTGGYEKIYKFVDSLFEWERPNYVVFDDARLELLRDMVTKRKRWVLGWKEEIPGMDPIAIVQGSPRSLPTVIFGSEDVRAWIGPNTIIEPLRAPRLREQEVIEGPLTLMRLTAGELMLLRAEYLGAGITPAAAQHQFGVLCNGKLIGAFAFSRGKYSPDELYMLCDIAIRPTRYKRLSKLVLQVATSKEVHHLMEGAYGRRIDRLSTTAFTKKPVSMKYRSAGWSIIKRGDGFLNYSRLWSGLPIERIWEDWRRNDAAV